MIESIIEALDSSRITEGSLRSGLSASDIKFAHDYLHEKPDVLEHLKDRIEITALDTCDFFGLQEIPVIEGDCISVRLNDLNSKDADVFVYNPDQFAARGCTSYHDISKIWAHECGHRILRDIYPDGWPAELGADMISGARSEVLGLPRGNFEDFLTKESGSISHPGGDLRMQAFEFGREIVSNMRNTGIVPTWEIILETFDNSPFSEAKDALSFADKCKKMEETDALQDTEETKKTGGSYAELKSEGWGWNSEPPREIHHMPSCESSPLERGDGPSIVMEYNDHRETASCGNSREAQEYRQQQKKLIEEGKFREALQMDIDDIHDKFGDKYDDSIEQMLQYVDKLEEENKI